MSWQCASSTQQLHRAEHMVEEEGGRARGEEEGGTARVEKEEGGTTRVEKVG